MNDELKYVPIKPGFGDFEALKELYNTAFPPEERPYSIENAMKIITEDPAVQPTAVYDEDLMIGFCVTVKGDGYNYLQFIAVNPNIRSKGYGGRILRKLLADNKDVVFFGSIEKPDPNGENYEIKIRRQNFYEKNGMITVNRSRVVNGVEFIVVTNKTGDEFDRCYELEMEKEIRQMEAAAKIQ